MLISLLKHCLIPCDVADKCWHNFLYILLAFLDIFCMIRYAKHLKKTNVNICFNQYSWKPKEYFGFISYVDKHCNWTDTQSCNEKRQIFDGSKLYKHLPTSALSQFLVLYLNVLALWGAGITDIMCRKLPVGHYIACNQLKTFKP